MLSRSYQVMEGGSTTLECDVISVLPVTKVSWRYTSNEGMESTANGQSDIRVLDFTLTTVLFTVTEATSSNQGSYQCSVTNSSGTVKTSLEIIMVIVGKHVCIF